MHEAREQTGFAPPAGHPLGHERRVVAVAELVATVGLALGVIVAATVVTAGMARAEATGAIGGPDGSFLALALIMGLLFLGMGGLGAMSLAVVRSRRRSGRD